MPGPIEIALTDRDGVIVWVNDAWIEYCLVHGGDPARCGVGRSYFDVCGRLVGDQANDAVRAALVAALAGVLVEPEVIELPCHSATSVTWFDVTVSSRRDELGHLLGARVTYCRSLSYSL